MYNNTAPIGNIIFYTLCDIRYAPYFVLDIKTICFTVNRNRRLTSCKTHYKLLPFRTYSLKILGHPRDCLPNPSLFCKTAIPSIFHNIHFIHQYTRIYYIKGLGFSKL